MNPHPNPESGSTLNVVEKAHKFDQRLNISATIVDAGPSVRRLDSTKLKEQMESERLICRSMEYGLRALGVFPGTSYRILRQFLCLFLATVNIFQYNYVILHFSEQTLSIFIETLNIVLSNSLAFIKMITLICNNRVLNNIMTCMDEDWKKCDISDKSVMTRMAHASRIFTNTIISLYLSGSAWFAFQEIIDIIVNPVTNGTRELLLKYELPFNIDDTSVYIPVMLAQYVIQIYIDSMNSIVISLLLAMILHVCGQIEILRRKISEVTRKRNVPKDAIRMVVVRHQRVISFCKYIKALYSYMVLLDIVLRTILICFSAFLIVISIKIPDETTDLSMALMCYANFTWEIFLYCFVGQYLNTKSQLIDYAAYQSLWYNLTPNEIRDLLFVIMRAQRHLTLMAGKFLILSFEQFANILKLSMSYASVLYAMY